MFSEMSLRNFKAFDDVSIKLKPISILIGPNNSGKSSIIAAIRLLVQTVESLDPDVYLLLNGVMGDMGTYKDIVYGNHRGRPIEIGFKVNLDKEKNPEDHLLKGDFGELELRLAFKFRTKRRELILETSELRKGGKTLLVTSYSQESERQLIDRIEDINVPSTIKSSLSRSLRMQNFIPNTLSVFISSSRDSVIKEFITEKIERNLREINRYSRVIARVLQRTEYLGAMRVPPSRLYAFTGERRKRVGASGENAATILAMDTLRSGGRSNKIRNAVSEWLQRANIASDVKISAMSDSFYEIRVKHPQTGEEENLADVGLGNSQILPVLVGGLNLQQGSTYLVEEPEIHLHPKAQAELGSFFFELYERGIQSIIETHSEHLIIRLQQYVADKKISSEDLQIYYIYPEGNKKIIKPIGLDSQGIFVEDWPHGFFPERLEEAKKLAHIRYVHSQTDTD